MTDEIAISSLKRHVVLPIVVAVILSLGALYVMVRVDQSYFGIGPGHPASKSPDVTMVIVVNVFVIIGIIALLRVVLSEISLTFTDEGVGKRDLWNRRHFVAWRDVTEVQLEAGITIASASDRVTVNPHYFRDQRQLDRLLESRIRGLDLSQQRAT